VDYTASSSKEIKFVVFSSTTVSFSVLSRARENHLAEKTGLTEACRMGCASSTRSVNSVSQGPMEQNATKIIWKVEQRFLKIFNFVTFAFSLLVKNLITEECDKKKQGNKFSKNHP
jgi:hypothetical protein